MEHTGTGYPTDEQNGVENGRTVKSDETLIAIIERLVREDTAGLTDIANELGLAKSTVHKHLTTLERHGFVTREGEQYRLGLRFLELGHVARDQRRIYHVAQPVVDRLAGETGEVACCVVEENNLGVFLCFNHGEDFAAHDARIGKAMHLHYLSGGIAMMAHMSTREIREIIDQYGLPEKTPQTITDETALFGALEDVRDQGFYIDRGESVEGIHTVSAPVIDRSDTPVAALTVGGPAQRLTDQYCRDEICPPLLTAVNEIELTLRHT